MKTFANNKMNIFCSIKVRNLKLDLNHVLLFAFAVLFPEHGSTVWNLCFF